MGAGCETAERSRAPRWLPPVVVDCRMGSGELDAGGARRNWGRAGAGLKPASVLEDAGTPRRAPGSSRGGNQKQPRWARRRCWPGRPG